LVGIHTGDDAGVYKLSENTALIQTVDYITPVIDDPYTFGQIAAANALSDVYAMGGVPLTALNIVCFPTCKLKIEVLKAILEGGLSKIKEAGAILIGGHSVDDMELKYGLSITGVVHPERIITNAGAKPGDFLFLTKPLGLGIIVTAIKGGLASEDAIEKATALMITLNRESSQKMQERQAHACTDITGFGLIGHAVEMAKASKVNIEFWLDKIPFISEALEYASMGLIPAMAYLNKECFSHFVICEKELKDLEMLLYDPQTSGGLLIAFPENNESFPWPCIGRIVKGEGKVKII